MSEVTLVRGLDGATLELRHAPGASVAEKKRLIARATGIDPALQRLTEGGQTAVDAEQQVPASAEDDALAASLERRLLPPRGAAPAAPVSAAEPPCGLRSLGDTCYLSAALQVLLTVQPLASTELHRAHDDERHGRLARGFAALARAGGDPAHAAQPLEYLHALLSRGLTGLPTAAAAFGDGAASCAECWDLLLRSLHLNGGDAVSALFCSSWQATAGGEACAAEQQLWSLVLPRAGALAECLARAGFGAEQPSPTRRETKRRRKRRAGRQDDAQAGRRCWTHLPPYLVLHFSQASEAAAAGPPLSFPIQGLDMAPYRSSAAGAAQQGAGVEYDLAAVVYFHEHPDGADAQPRPVAVDGLPLSCAPPAERAGAGASLEEGGGRAGHYTAAVRRGGGWWLCDDHEVRALRPERLVHRQAQMLLFQRRTDDAPAIAGARGAPTVNEASEAGATAVPTHTKFEEDGVAHAAGVDVGGGEEARRVREEIMRIATQRGVCKTLCPSEVSRSLYSAAEWRGRMERVRSVGRSLAAEGRIVVMQKGSVVDPERARGPIRYRLVE